MLAMTPALPHLGGGVAHLPPEGPEGPVQALHHRPGIDEGGEGGPPALAGDDLPPDLSSGARGPGGLPGSARLPPFRGPRPLYRGRGRGGRRGGRGWATPSAWGRGGASRGTPGRGRGGGPPPGGPSGPPPPWGGRGGDLLGELPATTRGTGARRLSRGEELQEEGLQPPLPEGLPGQLRVHGHHAVILHEMFSQGDSLLTRRGLGPASS